MATIETRTEQRVRLDLSLEEAMAICLVLFKYNEIPAVNEAITPAWDKLDDLRRSIMKQHPSDIPEYIREGFSAS